MTRTLLVFIALLALLGLGTVWVIEKGTGENIVPHQPMHRDISEVQSFYLTQKIRLDYWWNRLTGSVAADHTKARDEKPNPEQPRIIKWQDANGTWHFEDKQSAHSSPPPDHH